MKFALIAAGVAVVCLLGVQPAFGQTEAVETDDEPMLIAPAPDSDAVEPMLIATDDAAKTAETEGISVGTTLLIVAGALLVITAVAIIVWKPKGAQPPLINR